MQPGDVVGIGIHTGNALRGYESAAWPRERGRLGGVRRHPRHALSRRGARASAARTPWSAATATCVWAEVARATASPARRAALRGRPHRRRRVRRGALGPAAGGPLHVGLGADGARLPEALLVLLGLADRRPGAASARRRRVVEEIVELRRLGFRFIALADDNFYPVTLDDLAHGRAARRITAALDELEALRHERFELMEQLAQLPGRSRVLHADHDGSGRGSGVPGRDAEGAHPGALVGVESVTAEGLKDVYKGSTSPATSWSTRLRTFREHGVHVLGSFIFGLPSDRRRRSTRRRRSRKQAEITFAQFVMLTPFPGRVTSRSGEGAGRDATRRRRADDAATG